VGLLIFFLNKKKEGERMAKRKKAKSEKLKKWKNVAHKAFCCC
jgi:hypothetical protein